MLAIRAPRLFDGAGFLDDRVVVVDGGLVTAVLPPDMPAPVPAETLAPGTLLAPGFIDVQVNGGGGVLLNDDPTPAGAAAIVAAHRRHGTTGCLPTLITDRPEVLERLVAASPDILKVPGVLGLHIEGPFINPARKGAHREDYIRRPDAADLALLSRLGRAGRSQVTLAPERMPPGFVRALANAGVRVSIGHSEASAEEVAAAAAEGATGVTHLFNAQSQMQGRSPGVVGGAMADDRLFVGIIPDGLHVHPANLKVAFRAIGPERLMLVTDAMSSVGATSDRFMLMGREVHLADGRLTTADGTLAGAHLGMNEAVRNAVSMMGATLSQALAIASATPAAYLGLAGSHGRIAPGYVADLVALTPALDVVGTWIRGEWEPAAEA
ncbi:N-acetylglucosamine-6-phosphate deacetylase [Alsobacter sp. R-9]